MGGYSWLRVGQRYNKNEIVQKERDGKKGWITQRVRENAGVLLTAGFSWLGQSASISEHSVTR